jgi:hypothetical protein
MTRFVVVLAIAFGLASTGEKTWAEPMAPFVQQVFDWTDTSSRPEINVSRGTVMAWLKDPATIMPVNNAREYYLYGDRTVVIVPPGTAFITFPPWSGNDARKVKTSSRPTSDQYRLAVTRDGMWGIVDTGPRARRLFLAEGDLRRLAAAETSERETQVGMMVMSGYDLTAGQGGASPAKPVTLTRGELFRIVRDDGGDLSIDFKGDNPLISEKFQGPDRSRPPNVPDATYTIPRDQVRVIQITDDIVPSPEYKAWTEGSARYSVIFDATFANLRVPSDSTLTFGCGDKMTLTFKQSLDGKVRATAETSFGADFWTWFKVKFAVSGEIEDARSKELVTTSNDTSIRRRLLRPVEYRGASASDEMFWVGEAETCKASPNWRTIEVRATGTNGAVAEMFLHNEMYQLKDTGEEPAHPENPTEPRLDALKPGGNPFDRIRGVYFPKCFLQALKFESFVTPLWSDAKPYHVRAAIAMATSPQLGTSDLTQFFNDRSCASSAGPS